MDRNPDALWKALSDLLSDTPELADTLEIEMVGRVDPGIVGSMGRHGLSDYLKLRGYVPHSESIDAMCRSTIQLLLINQDAVNAPGRIPGKLFEYLAARRPVLCIGPTSGDAAGILAETSAGVTFAFDDVSGIRKRLKTWYERFRQGQTMSSDATTARFSRSRLTKEYAALLDSTCSAIER
jgi:hypothetical protein